ncbi:hypothetical protein DOTSEDRAFT_97536, partial [Dothistroma septosporum NZE10]
PLSYDPRALLNPKAAASSGASQPDSKDSIATPDGNGNFGISSMIENLHNTHERDDVPLRKRKAQVVEDDLEEGRKKAKGQSVQSGSGGMLSNHLKEERKQFAASSTIDLTNDDDVQPPIQNNDDEVQFIKESGDDEVCLGILHAHCNVHTVPYTSEGGAAKAVGKDYWPAMSVKYTRQKSSNTIMEVIDRSGKRFGNLDPKVASALCPLVDGSTVNYTRMKMFLPVREKKPGDYSGKRVSQNIKVDITLYGRRRMNKRIGQFLSQKQLWLATPVTPVGKPVVNPHDAKTLHLPKVPGQILGPRPQGPNQAVGRTVEEMRREASSMFDGLAKAEDLPEMEANNAIIKSPLMAHQKQALHFLMDRERGDYTDDSPSHSLWKYRPKDNGRPSWYHIITDGEVFEKPEPIQGGILADVMGLGKTLSILAVVAETRDAARRFRRVSPPDSEWLECNSRGTLIVCPKSVLSNWQEQIKLHTAEGRMRYYTYHGDSRMQDTEELSKYDIVLTTYNTAASEFNSGASKYHALRSINWFRIVLDEAHQIRNSTTKVFKGCCELEAERRWAVTGTPVQNTLNDLGALIKFLRLKPFDNMTTWHQYIMAPFKNGDVNVIQNLQVLSGSITLRRLKNTVGLPGRTQLRERLEFSKSEELLYRKFAAKTRTQFHTLSGGGNKLQGKSYAHILKSLGRLRAICAHGRELLTDEDLKDIEGDDPDNAIVVDIGDETEFGTDTDFVTEKQAYEYFKMLQDGNMAVCESCADHLINPDEQAQDEADSSSDDEDSDSTTGRLTSDSFDGKPNLFGHLTACYHFICTKCTTKHQKEVEENISVDKHHTCLHCTNYVRYGFFPLRRSILARLTEERKDALGRAGAAKWDENTYSGPHTKVKALLEDLRQSEIETSQLADGEAPVRSVVFSGWTQYLDLVEFALVQNNIGFVRIDGKMSVKQRSESLKVFNTIPHVRVMLVSIKAGGQGLNFTAANKAYVMEPQFNPGVEHQAVDRIHRIGQKRDVVIKHYIMKGSVEEGILNMQQKKEDLAKLSMERKRSRNEENKMRMDQLKELFK